MQINSFPIRVVPWIKASAIKVKLVTEYQIPVAPVIYRFMYVCLCRRITVDQTKVAIHVRNLPRRIDPTKVVATQGSWLYFHKMHN